MMTLQNLFRSRQRVTALAVAMAATFAVGAAQAQLDTQLVASGLSSPVYATSPVAGGPIFVLEKGGAIKAVMGGVTSNFLTIPVNSAGERGLLGLAFDPGYANPASAGYRRFFVDYIDPTSLSTVVASYRASADGLSADASSRVEVLRIAQPAGLSNHKAGWLGFKPGDANSLYIATGDGGGSNDPSNNGQNTNSLLGKMLRIDVNRDDFADPNVNYGVPTDNPFFGLANTRGEIWAYGLRNPWRNSFDRQTGDLWIGDVGQNAREEIDRIAAGSPGGQNFGWRVREGNIATPSVGGPLQAGMVNPLLDYEHSFGAAITGGYVVRDPNSPLFGRYIFADSVSGRIWHIAGDGSTQTMANAVELTSFLDLASGGPLGSVVSFGEGANGEIYLVDIGGKVVMLTAVPEPAAALMLLAGLGLLAVRRRRRD